MRAVVAVSESAKELLYPHISELIIGFIAFSILVGFMYKWAVPRVNQLLEQRQNKIRGDLESAEGSRREAEELLADYRRQLSGAREEANRVIEEARQTAEQMRRDLQTKAEEEARATVERAQDEIRAERDRVFEELKAQVGELSLALAGRVVGESLDPDRHLRLIDDYIRELSGMPSGNGNGNGHGSGSSEGDG